MNFKEIEVKWQHYWEKNSLFKAPEHPRKKFYDLVMFAYPSGDIHIGHFRNYTLGDALARYKKMQGFDVLHPFGWDAFGLPAEEAAIKRGVHPEEWTLNNIKVSRETLKRIGISYDWDREIITCLPEYYRWNQWIFLKMHEKGLAYQAESLVNWCLECKTVLANEQVQDNRCWRCHEEVVKKNLLQWFFKITAYAERLLDDLNLLEGWPAHIKAMQRNWIGRSQGAQIHFQLDRGGPRLSVFTTRPDTLFGVTFASIAPEHSLTPALAKGLQEEHQVNKFIGAALRLSEMERMAVGEKNGVFSGRYLIHPITQEKIPLWVADYVLAGYGTGIVMGVPAHDQRDFLFAKKYELPIKMVVQPDPTERKVEDLTTAFEEPGVLVNSEKFSGLPSAEGIRAITQFLKESGQGDFDIRYKLRDWLISRQRYWGTPLPMVHCSSCGTVPVPFDQLPVKLPQGKIDFIPKGRSPLEDVREFIETTCPKCSGKARRDPDTMDTFVDSSWYFLRYLDPKNEKFPFDPDKTKAWIPVDQYIGGVEHATMHLLYFRFMTKVLYDLGLVHAVEPVEKLFNQGMVLDKHGEVMSKSKGNTVSPRDLMDQVGADVARIAMFFAAPAEKEILWSEEGIGGAARFLNRVVRYLDKVLKQKSTPLTPLPEAVQRKLHQTIKKATDDLERFSLHTAIAGLMELLNVLEDHEPQGSAYLEVMERFAQLLSPFAPHVAEEMWEQLGKKPSIFQSTWPSYDPLAILEENVEIVVQINGKIRDRLIISKNAGENEVKSAVLASAKIKPFLENQRVKKFVFVPNRLINLVL